MENNYVEKYNDFLRLLVESTEIYLVEGNTVVNADDLTSAVTLEIDDKEKEIKLFTIPYPTDGVVLNPLNESVSESKATSWFYAAVTISIEFRIESLIKTLIQILDIQDELEIDPLKEISKYLELIDRTKTLNEIKTITKNSLEFCNIYYNRKLRKAQFRTGIFEASFINRINKKIRKKTIKFVDLLMCNIFGIKHDSDIKMKNKKLKEQFSYSTKEITCPKFECIIGVYLKILEKFNKIYEKLNMEEHMVSLELLQEYFEDLNEFYKISKWTTSSVTTKTEEVETTPVIETSVVPGGRSGVSTFALPGFQSSASVLPGMNVVPTLPGMNNFETIPVVGSTSSYPVNVNIIPTGFNHNDSEYKLVGT